MYIGEMSYAIGLGSLVPLPGFIVLVTGEALRILRLIRRGADESATSPEAGTLAIPQLAFSRKEITRHWASAFRQEAVKWGLVLTMIIFIVTLRDRDADVLIVISFVVGSLLNAPWVHRSRMPESTPA
jgi:hypothetical protein